MCGFVDDHSRPVLGAFCNRGNFSMKLKLLAACGIAASCLSAPASAQTAPADAVAATPAPPVMAQPLPQVGAGSALPSNTDVWLTLDRKLDSHDVKLGDPLTFKVARDVMLGNFIRSEE